MKTILHCIDTTGPGGAETVFIDLATRLPAEKYRAVAVIRGKGWVYEELCRRGITPILLDAKGSFNRAYLFALCKLIRREHADLVQSHLLGSNVYCAMAGLLTRTPVVTTFHGAVDIGERERFKGLKFGAINAGARCVVAVSESLRSDILERTPLKAGKTRVIYNGIDTTTFNRPRSDRLRRQFGWTEDDIIIGSLGNIRPAKGYDIMLRAAALLEKSQRSYRFVVAGQGKGQLYDELLQLREELGLQDRVHFLGFVENPAEFLSSLDMFLLTSTSEGFSIATIQAMSAKLPVVATRSGGPEEIVTHGEDGLLVAIRDPKAIADSVESLGANPGLRTALAEQARKHVLQTFDLSVMLGEYEKVYDAL
jgi:glycosyltransferase involved in cell wall biosynthesis